MAHIHDLYDFTASAYILHPTEKKLCLHFHKKLHSWLQPGGHIELDEDPEEALKRELLEEVGLHPDEYTIIDNSKQPNPRGSKTLAMPAHLNVHTFGDTGHKHIDFNYIIRAKTTRLTPQEGESTQILWVTIDEIRDLHRNGVLLDGTLDICEWVLSHY